MSLSKEEAEKILRGLEKRQEESLNSHDLESFIDHYHPEAVIIHKGVRTYYGREQVKEAFEPFIKGLVEGVKWVPPKAFYVEVTGDGQFLVCKGTFQWGSNPTKFPYEQVYKKHNGEYKVIYDWFEFSD